MASFDSEKLKTGKEWTDTLKGFAGIRLFNVWKDAQCNDIDWEIAPLLVGDGCADGGAEHGDGGRGDLG